MRRAIQNYNLIQRRSSQPASRFAVYFILSFDHRAAFLPPMLSPREFAIDVTQRLQAAGFVAYWAGGCVRDQLMDVEPKDYDVATSAKPDEIRDLFGRRRTLAIGASFGVITVLGPRSAGSIEVATFRQDDNYSDGRHPDRVTFSNAEQDARRRDFTVNGLFYDPMADQVIDYVGGQADLKARLIRAIGDPNDRFDEDKLRLLRAVRFASTLQFELDPDTQSVIRQHAPEVIIVSAERIAGELQLMLENRNGSRAVRLLYELELLRQLLPESTRFEQDETKLDRTLAAFERLATPNFAVSLATLLHEIAGHDEVDEICQRWRLPHQVTQTVQWILRFIPHIRRATELRWSELQPLLIDPRIEDLLAFAQANLANDPQANRSIEICRQRLAWPPGQLDPEPLITGTDLIDQGYTPGPTYSLALAAARQAQLDGEIKTKAQALNLARKIFSESGNSSS